LESAEARPEAGPYRGLLYRNDYSAFGECSDSESVRTVEEEDSIIELFGYPRVYYSLDTWRFYDSMKEVPMSWDTHSSGFDQLGQVPRPDLQDFCTTE
jgi:hypothetical protein